MVDIRIENFLYPYVRFFNASPNLPAADFYVGNSLVASNVAFGAFSPYVKVSTGRQEFKIAAAGNRDDTLATLTLNFGNGEVYTLAAVSDGTDTMAYGISEPTERDNLNDGHIRVCHLAPELGEIDVIANEYDILDEINYLEVSNYMAITPGRYDFKINNSETDETLLNVSAQNMRQGIYNTLYIIGLNGGEPSLRGILSVDAASYTGYYL